MKRTLYRTLLTFFALLLPVMWLAGGAGAQTLPATRTYKPLSSTALYAEYLPSSLLSLGVKAGQAVSIAIPDVSGNGHNIPAQTTVAYQPTLVAPTHPRGPLSVYSLRFAPGNYVPTGFAMTGEYTILYVTRLNVNFPGGDGGKHPFLQALGPAPNYNQWSSGLTAGQYYTRPASNHNGDDYGGYVGPTANQVGDLVTMAIMHSASGTMKVNYDARGAIANSVPAYADMPNLAIGDPNNGNLQGGADQNMIVMLLYSRQLSDAEIRAETYNIGVNLMHNQSYYLFGNSLLTGYTATAGLDALTLINQEIGDPDIHCRNSSIVGIQTNAMLSGMGNYTGSYQPIWGKQTAIWKELTNDIYLGAVTPAQAIANAQQFVGNCLAIGFDSVAVSTYQPRSSESPGDNNANNRSAINAAMATLVKSDPRLFLMDDGRDSRWGISGQQGVTTWYTNDSVHFNDAGYIAFAHDYIVPTLRNMGIGANVQAGTKRRIQ